MIKHPREAPSPQVLGYGIFLGAPKEAIQRKKIHRIGELTLRQTEEICQY
jgi:hypothetical protein